MSTASQAAPEKFVSDAGGGAALGMQCLASTVGTVIGQELGTNIVAKLVGGALLTVVGAFLTAPGRNRRRRIVAVALLLALLDALKEAASALAAGGRERPREPAGAGAGAPAWAPASWAAVALTAVIGFALGSGVTTARGAWTDGNGSDKTMIAIPYVRGRTEAVASRTLLTAGFRVRLSTRSSARASKRLVRGTNPPGGSMAEEGSLVTLVVSRFRNKKRLREWEEERPRRRRERERRERERRNESEKIAIPDVEGLSRETAMQRLGDVGFEVTTSSASSDSVAKGVAVGTDPPAGTRVSKGSRVRLIVSSGPVVVTVEVPEVAGMNSKEAMRTLRGAALSATVVREESEEVPSGIVIGTTPAAGERVPEGSAVTLTVSSGTSRDYDCADFATQEEAQAFFEEQGGPESDPYGLDGDGDGKACE